MAVIKVGKVIYDQHSGHENDCDYASDVELIKTCSNPMGIPIWKNLKLWSVLNYNETLAVNTAQMKCTSNHLKNYHLLQCMTSTCFD